MGSKKKKKKCAICLSREHGMHECPYVCDDCPKGDACRRWCMVDLCTKLYKIIQKLHNTSSKVQITKAFEKLDAFEESLEDAYEYHEEKEGRKCKSCSSIKRISRLQKSCEKLRESYEHEFDLGSSSDDEDYAYYSMAMPMIEVKDEEVGESQKSQKKPIDAPSPTLELAQKGVVDHFIAHEEEVDHSISVVNTLVNKEDYGSVILMNLLMHSIPHDVAKNQKHDVLSEAIVVGDEMICDEMFCDADDIVANFLDSFDDEDVRCEYLVDDYVHEEPNYKKLPLSHHVEIPKMKEE